MKFFVFLLTFLCAVSCNSSKNTININSNTPVPEENAGGDAEAPVEDYANASPVQLDNGNPIVAVVDSGVDIDHAKLRPYIFKNSIEVYNSNNGIDDDHNGYADDFNGWNFVDSNGVVIDPSWKFLYDEHLFAHNEIQDTLILRSLDNEIEAPISMETVNLANQITQEQRENYESFMGYSHGTHVAGITARNGNANILPIKLLASFNRVKSESYDRNVYPKAASDSEMKQFKNKLDNDARLASSETGEMLGYIASRGVRVINGSYGIGANSVYHQFIADYPSYDDAQLKELAVYAVERQNFYDSFHFRNHQDILMVVAAGNEGVNVDEFPDNPSMVDSPNILSVGATWNVLLAANFSNYSATNVDVFAPGVHIPSTAPSLDGNGKLWMSGTSQAAPYVAEVASSMLKECGTLSAVQLKKIIMGTVDKQSYLQGKCLSGGLVNRVRAIAAATKACNGLSIDQSIEESIKSVPAVQPGYYSVHRKTDRKSLMKSMKKIKPVKRPSHIQFHL